MSPIDQSPLFNYAASQMPTGNSEGLDQTLDLLFSNNDHVFTHGKLRKYSQPIQDEPT